MFQQHSGRGLLRQYRIAAAVAAAAWQPRCRSTKEEERARTPNYYSKNLPLGLDPVAYSVRAKQVVWTERREQHYLDSKHSRPKPGPLAAFESCQTFEMKC